MKDLFSSHFLQILELAFLLVLFVIGAMMLVWYPDNENLAQWVTGGVVIGTIVRALGSNGNGSKTEPKS